MLGRRAVLRDRVMGRREDERQNGQDSEAEHHGLHQPRISPGREQNENKAERLDRDQGHEAERGGAPARGSDTRREQHAEPREGQIRLAVAHRPEARPEGEKAGEKEKPPLLHRPRAADEGGDSTENEGDREASPQDVSHRHGQRVEGREEKRELRQVVVAPHVGIELAARPPALGREVEHGSHGALHGVECDHHTDRGKRQKPEGEAKNDIPALTHWPGRRPPARDPTPGLRGAMDRRNAPRSRRPPAERMRRRRSCAHPAGLNLSERTPRRFGPAEAGSA